LDAEDRNSVLEILVRELIGLRADEKRA